jgi:endonuclease/exonuclease/phosphatase (EEP) superfamily protein YafD
VESVLKNFGKDAHLVLLQEAQTTPELVRFATTNYLAADQVRRWFCRSILPA